MARNRLIAVLARGTIVVECGTTGGSLATAQATLQYKRRLYAVDWPEPNERNVGNRELLSLGAEPLRHVHDMAAVGQTLRARRATTPPPPPEEHRAQMSLF